MQCAHSIMAVEISAYVYSTWLQSKVSHDTDMPLQGQTQRWHSESVEKVDRESFEIVLFSEALHSVSSNISSLTKRLHRKFPRAQKESGELAPQLSPTGSIAQFLGLKITNELLKSLEKLTGTLQERIQRHMNISQWSLELWARA